MRANSGHRPGHGQPVPGTVPYVDIGLVVLGGALLLADLGVVFALRRRAPADRVSLYSLPIFIVGFTLIVLGVT